MSAYVLWGCILAACQNRPDPASFKRDCAATYGVNTSPQRVKTATLESVLNCVSRKSEAEQLRARNYPVL